MNEHPFKKTLRHLAEDTFPPGTDLWPEIQQQLEGVKTHKRIKIATRFSNFADAFTFGAVLVLLVFGLAWMLSNTGPQPAVVTVENTQPSELLQLVATSSPVPVPTVTFVPTNPIPSVPNINPTPISYVVQGDDTCISIATMFRVSVQSITTLNKLSSSCTLEVGQTLLIPQPTPTPNVNYLTYRDSGIEKILAGDLEGGLADLNRAEVIQGWLDGDAPYYSDLASRYLIGVSFWEVDWEEAVYFFRGVAHFEPGLHDSTGLTAADRYVTALEAYISQLVTEQDWCQALRYHKKLEEFSPDKAAAPAFQTTRTELASQCSIQNPPIISMDSDSETIRQSLIDSELNWTTIWVDAMITRIDGDTTTLTHARIWFVDPDKGREMYDFENDNLVDRFVFMNNTIQTIFDLNLSNDPLWTKTTQVLDSLPNPSLKILNPGPAFAMTGMQSSGGIFQPTGTDTIAGRETLIVEWTDGAGELKDRLWVDIYTGVVLKWQNLREGFMDMVEGEGYLMDAEIDVLEIVYDERFREDILFNPAVPDEPIYMEYPDISAEVPDGNLDLAALQAQVEFPILTPNILPEYYTFSGWHYKPDEASVTLEYDCGRGTPDWWAFVIQITPYSEEHPASRLLRSFVGQGGQIESVMIGGIEGVYLQGDWVEQFDPVTLKANGKEWNSKLNTHHLLWVQDGILYWIYTSRALTDPGYAGPCRIDKEDLLAFAESLQ